MPMINKLLWEIGVQWEKYLGYVCDGGGTYPDVFYPDGHGGYRSEATDKAESDEGEAGVKNFIFLCQFD